MPMIELKLIKCATDSNGNTASLNAPAVGSEADSGLGMHGGAHVMIVQKSFDGQVLAAPTYR